MIQTSVRGYKPSDEDFVVDAWLKSYRKAHEVLDVKNSVYYSEFRDEVLKVLKSSQCLVQCDPENEDFIYSFIVFTVANSHLIIHYAYTKNSFRRFGLVKKLIDQIAFDDSKTVYASCWTRICDELHKEIVFNPYLRRHVA